jgi:hypothetical protein
VNSFVAAPVTAVTPSVGAKPPLLCPHCRGRTCMYGLKEEEICVDGVSDGLLKAEQKVLVVHQLKKFTSEKGNTKLHATKMRK